MAPGIHAARSHIWIHCEIAAGKKQILPRMNAVVAPFFLSLNGIVMPGILTAVSDIRVLELISFREKYIIRRMITVVIPLAPAINNVVLPGSHSLPAAFRIEDPIAVAEKASCSRKRPADEILEVKTCLHMEFLS